MPTAFVTGASSGFGFHLSRRLLGLGWKVVATDADPAGMAGISPGDPALLQLKMDVRSDHDVRLAVAEALAWSPVDALVNNAGYAFFGPIEEGDLRSFQDLLEVNVVGVARVTQALLPALRERGGTVVMLSSVAGRTVFPESGFYAATKHAVEALSEALFQETCTFGVKVRVIEPGSFDTGFLKRAAEASKPRLPTSPYASLFPLWDARKWTILEKPQDPILVAEAIAASLADPSPFKRFPVGPDARRLLGLRDAIAPDAWALLAGERNGLAAPAREPGQVLSPSEVLELLAGPPAEALPRLEATLAAMHHGHLDHWDDDERGRHALERLKTIG
jgi:NAD(P)-dependent dehydrogenase (short-subunit alcohol dehydrogenase family)